IYLKYQANKLEVLNMRIEFNSSTYRVRIKDIKKGSLILDAEYNEIKNKIYLIVYSESIGSKISYTKYLIMNNLRLPLSVKTTNNVDDIEITYEYSKYINFIAVSKIYRNGSLKEVAYYGIINDNFGHIDGTFNTINSAFKSVDKVSYLMKNHNIGGLTSCLKYSFRGKYPYSLRIIKNGSIIGDVILK
ncbi:MAG: hypothetical protein N2485_08390, partial [bacterium]|nr:hypothetical protein [bacterium]